MRPFRSLFVAAVSVAAFVGCDCGGTKPPPAAIVLEPKPATLAFVACPQVDAMGRPVPEVFPDQKSLKLLNNSRRGATLGFKFNPPSDAYTLTWGDAGAPTFLDAFQEIEVPVAFGPKMTGISNTTLEIADGEDGGAKIPLTGEAIARAATATIATKPQDEAGTFQDCGDRSAPLSPNCTAAFPGTLFGETSERSIKIRNLGCPTLKITGLVLEALGGNALDFEIIEPSQLPTATAPIELNPAIGTEEITIKLRFKPVDDGSGNLGRDATLKIVSNDPVNGAGNGQPSNLAISATALKPALIVTPSNCDFSASSDNCGYPSRMANQGKFVLTNDGNVPVRIDSVQLTPGPEAANRFNITMNPNGQTLGVGQSADLLVSHMDQSLYVSGRIVVSGSLMGQAAGSGGRAAVQLYGGVRPCLETEPANTLAIENPMTVTSAAPFKIKNRMGCGTLVINSVTVDQSQFFRLGDPMIPANHRLAGGEEITGSIVYTKPVSGGTQLGTLRIKTNDSSFGADGKQILLQGNSPLDELPIAAMTVCRPSMLTGDPDCRMGSAGGSTSVRLQDVTAAMDGKKYLTISGINSYDPVPGMAGQTRPATKYLFRLQSFPMGQSTALLQNHGVQITTPTTKLELATIGVYTVQLRVFDSASQGSGTYSMVINVVQ